MGRRFTAEYFRTVPGSLNVLHSHTFYCSIIQFASETDGAYSGKLSH